MNLADQLITLGQQLAADRDAAHDLWTWLPSHAVTYQNHGDYTMEYRPSNSEVMREAAAYLAHLKHPERPLGPEDQQRFEQCACGEHSKSAVQKDTSGYPMRT